MRKNNDVKAILFLLYTLLIALFGFLGCFSFYIYQNEKISEEEIQVAKADSQAIMMIEPVALPEDDYEFDENQNTIQITPKEPEPEPPVVTSNEEFYYTQLESNSKGIYTALKNGKNSLIYGNKPINIPNNLREIILDSNGEEKIKGIFTIAMNAFEYDNPEVFYIDYSKFTLYYEDDGLGNYKNYLKNGDEVNNYYEDAFSNESDVKKAQEEIDLIVEGIIEDANNMNSDYDKIKYVHDWLVKNIEYDETLNKANRNNIYGAFVEKQVTCGGYAKAFKYIMDKLNIECIIVQGKATDNGNTEYHAWNFVKLNREWYGIDCTWDDPVIVGGPKTNEVYYTYFLKGEKEFENTHEVFDTFYGTDVKIEYPSLSSNGI